MFPVSEHQSTSSSVLRLLIPFLSLLATLSTAGEEERIRNLDAWASGSKVSVSFELTGAFERAEIVQAIQSGLPTVIAYELELIRKRPNWFDTTITTARVEVGATYNAKTGEYLVNYRRDRRLVRSETISEFEAVVDRMTMIRETDVLPLGNYRSYKTVVRVRAVLVRELLFYIVPRSVTTPWELARVRSERGPA